MFRVIGFSLSITILLSLGAGFVFKDIIGFWEGVVAAVIAQFIASYVFYSTKVKNDDITSEKTIEDRLIEMQTTLIECPCGKNSFMSPIFLNFDNVFLCDKCNSKFKVEMNFDSVLVTEPLNIENAFNALKAKELS